MELGQRVEVLHNDEWVLGVVEAQSGKCFGVRLRGTRELIVYDDPDQVPGAGKYLRAAPSLELKAQVHLCELPDPTKLREIVAPFYCPVCRKKWRSDGASWYPADASAPSSAEERIVSSTGGEKGKKKERYDLIPAEALRKVAELYGIAPSIGKYEDRNWERGYDWSLSFAALQRHIWQFWNGEDMDEEMNMEHVACAIFHALALLTFMEEHPEFDDRPTTLKRKNPPAS